MSWAAAHGALKLLSHARTTAPRASEACSLCWIAQLESCQVSLNKHITRVCRVSVIAFAMSWGFGWPFRLLRLAATGASREESQHDSELLPSQRSVSDASRALAEGGAGDLNSVPPGFGRSCIVDCRIRNYWSKPASDKLMKIEEQLRGMNSRAARALKPELVQEVGELASLMAVCLVQHRAHKVWRTVWNSVVVMASRLLTGGNARCVSLYRSLVGTGRSWVFVAGGKNPRRSGPWVEWVSHCLAILSWVEETVSFTGTGHRRQKLAARRVLFLPRSLATKWLVDDC